MNYKKEREIFIGQRFGRLVILEEIGKNKWKKPIVKCLCDCGKQFNAILGNIRFRNIHQCKTCRYLFKKTAEKGKAGFNKLLITYKANAKNRNIEFKLSDEDFKKLTSSDCSYCGMEPKTETKTNKTKNKEVSEFGNYIYNGVDRIDNSKGYELKNCVACCEVCNKMKSIYSKEDFINHIKKIYEFQRSLK